MSKLSEQVNFLINADISTLVPIDTLILLNDIFSNIGIIQHYNLHPGFFVIRVRPDFEYKDSINIDELSYKPKSLNKKYQRASTPYDTMFYCCSCERRGIVDKKVNVPFTDIEDGLYISLFETISELRSSDVVFNHGFVSSNRTYKSFRSVNNFTKKVTYSIWVVNHFLTLALLPIYKKNEINTSFMYFPHMNYDFFTQLNIEPIDVLSMVNFYQYLTNQFTKHPIVDDKQYLISAYASKILCMKHDYDGVVYPSVRCDDNGINFAIAPDVIDKGWLRCVELGNFQLVCKDSNLLLEDITTQFKYPSSGESSLLERSIQLNKLGKNIYSQ